MSEGLESYDILWQVGDAQSGRLVLQGENNGVAARLVLDEMGTTMTKELTDSRTGLRFHQGSTLAASEMQWFPADATEGDTVVRVDEWFGLETGAADAKRSDDAKASTVPRARDTQKTTGSAQPETGSAGGPAGVPRSAARACVVQTTKGTTGTMHAYLADLFDMALGLDDAVYALPTTDTTVTLDETSDDGSESTDDTALTTEESQALSSLANDLVLGLVPAAGGDCTPEVLLTIRVVGEGITLPLPDSHTKTKDEEVYVFAFPSYGFSRWDCTHPEVELPENPAHFIIKQSCILTAHMKDLYRLTVDIYPSEEAGEIQVFQESETEVSYEYYDGTTVGMVARPNPGYGFVEWQGDYSGSEHLAGFTMDADKDVLAVFEELEVDFVEAEGQDYGFDDWTERQTPWKSVEIGHTDQACAVISVDPVTAVSFESASTQASILPQQAQETQQTVQISGAATTGEGEVYAKVGNDTKATMKVAVYEPLSGFFEPAVALVRVALPGQSPPGEDLSVSDLESYLNGVFSQAVYTMQLAVAVSCEYDYDYVVDNEKLDEDTSEITGVLEWCEGGNVPGLNPALYQGVVYVVEEFDDASTNGFAKRDYRYAFVKVNNRNEGQIFQTCAHELGHVLGGVGESLEDPDNLMCYLRGTRLRKPQWDSFPHE